jgi:hypothetical protein
VSNVYTTRLLAVAASNGASTAFHVPVGKRAVIRSMTALQSNGSTGTMLLSVNGMYCSGMIFQGPSYHPQVVNLTAVAYAGEEIHVWSDVPVYCHIAGYLFDDP